MGAVGASTTLADDTEDTRPSGVPLHPAAATAAFGAVLGALAGIGLGAVEGPSGMVIGGVLGIIGGAGLADVLSKFHDLESAHEQRVDADIGVLDGHLGSAPPDQPPAFIGAYSSGAAGSAGRSSGTAPDEGPIPKPE
jgi:hypothetical protein